MTIQQTFDNITDDEKRKRYLTARTILRKSYLSVLNEVLGIHSYSYEDDTFMDALDIKIEMLMLRAEGKNKPDTTDPFAHITRPSTLLALEQQIADEAKKINQQKQVSVQPPSNLRAGWNMNDGNVT